MEILITDQIKVAGKANCFQVEIEWIKEGSYFYETNSRFFRIDKEDYYMEELLTLLHSLRGTKAKNYEENQEFLKWFSTEDYEFRSEEERQTYKPFVNLTAEYEHSSVLTYAKIYDFKVYYYDKYLRKHNVEVKFNK